MLFLFALGAGGQTLEFSSEVYTAGEGQASVTLTVIKSGEASGTITVKYTTGDFPPGPSTATASQDYSPSTGTLTFGPSETMKQFTVPILEDAVYESTETFFVTLSEPTGGAAVRAPSTAQVHINENDPPPTVQFSSATYSVVENTGAATLTITKSGASQVPTTVYYKTRDGTAAAPSDYTFTGDDLTASVVFEPLETSKQIQIPVHNNGFSEPDETFEVFFTVIQNGSPGTPAIARVTIHDDDPQGPEPPARALNISTRSHVQTGARVMIAGFIITGNDNKPVVLRGLGPSLGGAGISPTQAMGDPVLQLRGPDGSLIFENDNWKDNPEQRHFIEGTVFEPKDDRESVIAANLSPGAYTAILSGKANGVGLVEVYDNNRTTQSELANLSTRGYAGFESDVLVGGFILGADPAIVQIAIRGLGPSLSNAGVNGVITDPALHLHNTNGAVIASNDDWQSDPVSAAQLAAHGLALPHPKEAGLFVKMAPGAYTVIFDGKWLSAGIGLVEVYNLK